MEWVDRLLAATGWDAEPAELDWSETEAALGTPLPADFKELRRRFAAWGSFSDYIVPLKVQDGSETVKVNHESRLRSVTGNPDRRRLYKSYGLFGDSGATKGLLQWGYSLIEDEYYWLADASVDPSNWPVVAREDPLEPFHQFDMTASEFIYRVLKDPEFEPFTVAPRIETPYYRAY
ncbi:SMI1/KNR4 family protein [Streptomyces sp. MK7]|uniref:SMI1/KNR4 family protein n=1 Tax=Streptomyces sp. MK7 TaxID=3067635 RepID=UPI00292E5AF3|nr:SMI1/KNR4 family protein [Streptomyces sp. MK7]